MKIFLSWSGDYSRQIAGILSTWLQKTIQAVEPFFTPEMEKGVKWSNEIDNALEGTRFGIVCLTPDNLTSTWIHFETGALSKTLDASIWTFLVGLKQGDVPQPLGKFQHTILQKEDVYKLIQTINKKLRELGSGFLADSLMSEIFNENWPKLEAAINAIKKPELPGTTQNKEENVRPEADVLNEILEVVRTQQRQLNTLSRTIVELVPGARFAEVKRDVTSLIRDSTSHLLSSVSTFLCSFDLDVSDEEKERSDDLLKVRELIHFLTLKDVEAKGLMIDHNLMTVSFTLPGIFSDDQVAHIIGKLQEHFGKRFRNSKIGRRYD